MKGRMIENFVYISPALIKHEVEIGNMTLIARRKKYVGMMEAQLEMEDNIYLRINRMDNAVFLNLQNGIGVIIPEYINRKEDAVSVPASFTKFYISIDWDNQKPCAYSVVFGKCRKKAVWQMIWALVRTGDPMEMMEGMDVHHKGRRFNNLLEMTSCVEREYHKSYHQNVNAGTHKSHRQGVAINRHEEFQDFCTYLENELQQFKDRPM